MEWCSSTSVLLSSTDLQAFLWAQACVCFALTSTSTLFAANLSKEGKRLSQQKMAKIENKTVLYITTFTFEKPFISAECERSKPSHSTEKYVPDFNLKELCAFHVRLSRNFSNGPQHGFKSLMNTFIACSMLKCAFSILQHTSVLASHSIIAQVIWRKLFLLSKTGVIFSSNSLFPVFS